MIWAKEIRKISDAVKEIKAGEDKLKSEEWLKTAYPKIMADIQYAASIGCESITMFFPRYCNSDIIHEVIFTLRRHDYDVGDVYDYCMSEENYYSVIVKW